MSQKTIMLLRSALLAQPDSWELRIHLAELLATEGEASEVVALLTEYSPMPDEQCSQLAIAELLAKGDSNLALQLLGEVVTADKACAKAYRIRADIYWERGMVAEARKNYGVAAVIDESLEDPRFEAQLDGESPDERQPLPRGEPPAREAREALTTQGIPESEMLAAGEEGFVETDRYLDDAVLTEGELIDFSKIGGMEDLKERVRMSIIYPFKNKELFGKFKKKSGGGLLFYGPPGCGKTLVARATAGECGAHFIDVSIHDVLSKWIGESEARLHDIFKTARRKAPTIIFIDEIDALGVKRSDAGHTASTVNTLLTEIDGASSRNEDVLVIGATNTSWRIDSAFRRPGRFDHVLLVPPPDLEARIAIFEIMLEGIPQKDLDVPKLAKLTNEYSGADIRSVVETASDAVVSQIMKTGKEVPLTQKDLTRAVKKTRATTLEWLEQASNYASYSNQSGLYDDLADYLKTR